MATVQDPDDLILAEEELATIPQWKNSTDPAVLKKWRGVAKNRGEAGRNSDVCCPRIF